MLKKVFCKAYLTAFIVLGLPCSGFSHQVIFESPEGENYLLAISPEDSFISVVNTLYQCLKESMLENGVVYDYENIEYTPPLRLQIQPVEGGILVRSTKPARSQPREYNQPVTPQEKKDIAYVVKTLGFENQAKIMFMQDSLNSAGDRIDHIHPFQFLATIFTDEELKVAMRKMQGKMFVWSTFVENLVKTGNEENARGNMAPFLNDFSRRVKIDPKIIQPSVQNAKWEKMINLLIDHIPREGKPDRYD